MLRALRLAERVGACTDAIAAAGISRVVYAIPDPNPKNRGKAKRALAKSGIECECWALDKKTMNRDTHDEELLCRQDAVRIARDLIAPFAKHVLTGMPYVAVVGKYLAKNMASGGLTEEKLAAAGFA